MGKCRLIQLIVVQLVLSVMDMETVEWNSVLIDLFIAAVLAFSINGRISTLQLS